MNRAVPTQLLDCTFSVLKFPCMSTWCTYNSRIWYPCGVRVIYMWCPCDTNVVRMRYLCGVHVILIWCACDTHVVLSYLKYRALQKQIQSKIGHNLYYLVQMISRKEYVQLAEILHKMAWWVWQGRNEDRMSVEMRRVWWWCRYPTL